jgi:ribosomal protein S8
MSTVTDPIADLLARVRNGAQAQKPELFVPYSKIKAEIARILKDEGYITDYELDRSAAHPRIKITNKLVNRSCAITGLRRVSRPGLRRYVGAQGNSARARRNGDRRFSQRRVVFCPGGKQKSKTSAGNCWPTFGKILCRESETNQSHCRTK